MIWIQWKAAFSKRYFVPAFTSFSIRSNQVLCAEALEEVSMQCLSDKGLLHEAIAVCRRALIGACSDQDQMFTFCLE